MLLHNLPFKKFLLTVFICLSTFATYAGESAIQWNIQPLLAGKVSLYNESYQVICSLGTTRTSPDLQLPLQLVYDAKSTDRGLVGHGWRIPQLESAAVPVNKNMDWLTPWGETIRFFPKANLTTDELKAYKDDIKGKASHFAPYSEWEATGEAGKWRVIGKGVKKGWRFDYEEARLIKITAPSGFDLQFRYDKEGRPLRIIQEKRTFAELEYSKLGVLTSLRINEVPIAFTIEMAKVGKLPDVLAAARVTWLERLQLKSYQLGTLAPVEFAYNESGFLTEQRQGDFVDTLTVDAETFESRIKYLAVVADNETKRKSGTRVTDPEREHIHGRLLADNKFIYNYPAKGRITLTNKADQIASYSYEAARGVMSVTDFSGKKSTIYYFMRHDVAYNGRVRQVVDGRDRIVVSYRYDKDSGNVTRVRDMADNEILMSYDQDGNLTKLSKRGADELEARPILAFSHDNYNHMTKIARLNETGMAVQTTTLTYTAKNIPSKIDDGRSITQINYNNYGFPVSIYNTFGQTCTMVYSHFNRLESVTDYDGKTVAYTYDDNGMVKSIENFTGANKKSLISSLTVEYSDNGLPLAYIDHRNRRKFFERDEFGRIAKEFFPDNTQIAYVYDTLGQISKVLDQNQHEIKFDWDLFGLAKRTTPENQVNDYDYDKYGLLKKIESKYAQTKIPDRVFTYEHDEFDRITKIIYDNVRSESMDYDVWGRVVKLTQEDGVANTRRIASMKYDHFDRLEEKIETVYIDDIATEVTTRHYVYNPWGQLTERIITQNKLNEQNNFKTKATWKYDKYGRLISMTEGRDHVTYEFGEKYRLVKRIANGTPVFYSYTPEGWLKTKSMGAPLNEAAPTTFLENQPHPSAWLRYEYDADGRIRGREVNGHYQHYEYDVKDQLLAVIDNSGQEIERYFYDSAGNILTKIINGQRTTYTYDAANQLITSTDRNGIVTTFTYDGAGRIIQEGDKVYRYGFLDKIVEINEADQITHTYQYWSNGQLANASHLAKDQQESFLWDDLTLIRRNDTVYLNEPHINGGNPILANGNPLLEDMLGNTLAISEQSLTTITRTAFGERNGGNQQNVFFTGKPEVEGLGYTFLFRNYNPSHGKWYSADPLAYPAGWNNMAYCNNLIFSSVDPLGCIPVPTEPIMPGTYITRVVVSEEWVSIAKVSAGRVEAPGGQEISINKTITGYTEHTLGGNIEVTSGWFGFGLSYEYKKGESSEVGVTASINVPQGYFGSLELFQKKVTIKIHWTYYGLHGETSGVKEVDSYYKVEYKTVDKLWE